MKKLLLLPVFVLLACKKEADPTPLACSGVLAELLPANAPAPVVPSGVASSLIKFLVLDSQTGQPFNARLTGVVFYYPLTMTQAQIRSAASFTDCEGWQVPLTPTWQSITIPGTGPGSYNGPAGQLSIAGFYQGLQAVVVWRFTDASQSAPTRYKFSYCFLGEVEKAPTRTFGILTDRQQVGL